MCRLCVFFLHFFKKPPNFLKYRAMKYFDPPFISSISNEFALSEKYAEFWWKNLQLTAECSNN